VDFDATREYKKEFMDNWLRLLQAAASEDRTACTELSRSLGYLTGEEHEVRSSPTYFHPAHLLMHQTQIVLDAHIAQWSS
jgi:predicted unusual protein kinase regulating ubiquinone biosynthesis (AarF/ABC1/UbiB family)